MRIRVGNVIVFTYSELEKKRTVRVPAHHTTHGVLADWSPEKLKSPETHSEAFLRSTRANAHKSFFFFLALAIG